jgi:hypothetical protein
LFSAAQASLPLTAAALHIGGGECGGIAGVLGFSPVVGYQNKGFDNAQYNITAATFVPVSGDKDEMTLGDFVPNDEFVSSAITFMTPGGATPRVEFDGNQVAQRYVYWAEGDGA